MNKVHITVKEFKGTCPVYRLGDKIVSPKDSKRFRAPDHYQFLVDFFLFTQFVNPNVT
jgi:hypothetical protein